jgi:hypothetical protein
MRLRVRVIGILWFEIDRGSYRGFAGEVHSYGLENEPSDRGIGAGTVVITFGRRNDSSERAVACPATILRAAERWPQPLGYRWESWRPDA